MAAACQIRERLGGPRNPYSDDAIVDRISTFPGGVPRRQRPVARGGCVLKGPEQSAFSAATLFKKMKRRILHNDAHHPRRQSSNISHELGHAILGHPPGPPLKERGCGHFDKTLEEESHWLEYALLISEEAALFIIQDRMPIEEAVEIYGVSKDLIQFRIRKTGADKKNQRGYRYQDNFG